VGCPIAGQIGDRYSKRILVVLSLVVWSLVTVATGLATSALMLLAMRDRLVRLRTQLSNTIRGHAGEFGLIAAKGLCRIEPLLERIAEDETLPVLARELFALHQTHYARIEAELEQVEAKLIAWHRANECSRRLTGIPGVGPIIATLLVMKVPAPELFRSGRDFAAWIGLTPKDHSTAGKVRLGGITRAGDEALRAALVTGASAVIQHARRGHTPPSPWLARLIVTKKPKLAAVALANKTARIAWKMMVSGETYQPRNAAPAEALAA
jgi:transposase